MLSPTPLINTHQLTIYMNITTCGRLWMMCPYIPAAYPYDIHTKHSANNNNFPSSSSSRAFSTKFCRAYGYAMGCRSKDKQ